MRVALIRNLPEENWPSIEVYADQLAGALRALRAGLEIVEVQVGAWRTPHLQLPTPYGRPTSAQTLALYLSRWVRYPWVLRRVQADIYHILDNSYGHLALFLDAARTIVTSHGGTPCSWRRWNPAGPAMWLFDAAFRAMLRASNIITVSEYARRELLAEAQYPASRVRVVPHGVDSAFHPLPDAEREHWRAQLLPSGDRHLLLHVGHSIPRKNVDVLYQAVGLLRHEGRAVHLLRIGGLPTPAQIELIKSLRIDRAVTHAAHIPNSQLPAYYGAADAFVFPSLYEGFGLPLIEAMACGTPVICTDWALFHEVCADAARYVDSRQPEALATIIGQVLGNGTLAGDLGERGLARAGVFTWAATAQATLAVYMKALEELA